MEYKTAESFVIKAEIESQHSNKRWNVASEEIEDMAFLRHIPVARINDKPLLVGYFAVRPPK